MTGFGSSVLVGKEGRSLGYVRLWFYIKFREVTKGSGDGEEVR